MSAGANLYKKLKGKGGSGSSSSDTSSDGDTTDQSWNSGQGEWETEDNSYQFGGEIEDTTPIITAGGEMLIDPEIVAALGDGDPKLGTKILCDSVQAVRAQVQAYQKSLPRPSSK